MVWKGRGSSMARLWNGLVDRDGMHRELCEALCSEEATMAWIWSWRRSPMSPLMDGGALAFAGEDTHCLRHTHTVGGKEFGYKF